MKIRIWKIDRNVFPIIRKRFFLFSRFGIDFRQKKKFSLFSRPLIFLSQKKTQKKRKKNNKDEEKNMLTVRVKIDQVVGLCIRCKRWKGTRMYVYLYTKSQVNEKIQLKKKRIKQKEEEEEEEKNWKLNIFSTVRQRIKKKVNRSFCYFDVDHRLIATGWTKLDEFEKIFVRWSITNVLLPFVVSSNKSNSFSMSIEFLSTYFRALINEVTTKKFWVQLFSKISMPLNIFLWKLKWRNGFFETFRFYFDQIVDRHTNLFIVDFQLR